MLKDRHILLGITGSIAAYKSADLARRLQEKGAQVTGIMTNAACRFITPYTLEALTGKEVFVDLYKNPLSHINLSRESELFIIAPITANSINKLSCGIADEILSCVWLAYQGPSLMAPAMNERMYHSAIVQKNISSLKSSGVYFVGPEKGGLVCGEQGTGRMADIESIVEAAEKILSPKDLSGFNIVITAGPTREAIDPVRYISNRSSGKMGYAIANAACLRGASVILISGPSHERAASGINVVSVESAKDMETAVLEYLSHADILIMSAAVSDVAPEDKHKRKLKKENINTLSLKKTNDILKRVSRKKRKCITVGFAAESGNDVSSATNKLREKKVDFIVMNDITRKGAGFEHDTNIVTILSANGDCTEYPLMKKTELAQIILDKVKERQLRT